MLAFQLTIEPEVTSRDVLHRVRTMGQAIDDDQIRKLWPSDVERFREHLLRLDPASRLSRFAMPATDPFLERYAEACFAPGALAEGIVMLGHIRAGAIRGAAELRPIGRREAEAAFSVEPVCRGRGVGTALFARVIATARHRKLKRLYMSCLSHNRAMQALARKFSAQLIFESADVLSLVDHDQQAPAPDGDAGYATAILDLQTRWFNLLPRRLSAQT